MVRCEANAEGIQVSNWGRVLATLSAGTGGVVRLEAGDLGRGPARVSAAAVLSDGRRIAARTLAWTPEAPRPPEIADIRGVEKPGGTPVWQGRAGFLGPDEPATADAWRIVDNPSMKTDKGANVDALGAHRYALTPVTQRGDVWRWIADPGGEGSGATVTFECTKPRRFTRSEYVGIAFNIATKRRFDFFGLVGGWGWAFAEVRAGKWSVVASRPDAVALDHPHTLSLTREASGGVRGWIEGVGSLTWAAGTLGRKPVGVAVESVKGAVVFSNPAIRIAEAPIEEGSWAWPRQTGPDASMLLRIRQGTRWTEKVWKPR